MADWNEVARSIRESILRVPAVATAFLKVELPIFTGEIQKRFYTTGQEGVNTRSGRARRGWDWDAAYPTAMVFNTVAHADHSQDRVIRGKGGKKLAVPVGKALTPSKVARFTGPRDPALPPLTFIPRPGKAPILADTRNPRRTDVYFVLLPSVTIPARTQGLKPYAEKYAAGLVDRLGDHLLKELGAP